MRIDIGCVCRVRRDHADDVGGRPASSWLWVGSALAALGCDFCSDIFCDSEAVLVYGIPPIVRDVGEALVGRGRQRRITRVQFES